MHQFVGQVFDIRLDISLIIVHIIAVIWQYVSFYFFLCIIYRFKLSIMKFLLDCINLLFLDLLMLDFVQNWVLLSFCKGYFMSFC